MKLAKTWACAVASAVLLAPAQAQLWRCGSVYTDDHGRAKAGECKPVESSNVTIVEPFRGQAIDAVAAPPVAEAADERLARAQERHEKLLEEYNDGRPARHALDKRNYQRYLDRVEKLKREVERSEEDLARLRASGAR